MILGLTGLSLIIWLYLTFGHHGFWRRREFLPTNTTSNVESWPSIISLTPARNEAELIAKSFSSILEQSYQGSFESILIDDSSEDDTSAIAKDISKVSSRSEMVHIIQAEKLPQGWSGKLWALQSGHDYTDKMKSVPDYYWLSDADISHEPETLTRLVQWAQKQDIALVSLMVTLNCKGFWERLIIPAFIYYFQLLYPFHAVNNVKRSEAGAAGGCILISRAAVQSIGGFHAIKDKLIDDCSLAQAVKAKGHKIWLGHGTESLSLRNSARFSQLCKMVARTAFVQLSHSYIWLLLAVLSMFLIYILPVLSFVYGIAHQQWLLVIIAASTWSLMAYTYWPTIRAYKLKGFETFLMPFTASLFMGMTLYSSWLHFRGLHAGWHNRSYASTDKHRNVN